MSGDRWQNIEITITVPTTDDYDAGRDNRFDGLVDFVYDLYGDETVMSSRIVWSDAGD